MINTMANDYIVNTNLQERIQVLENYMCMICKDTCHKDYWCPRMNMVRVLFLAKGNTVADWNYWKAIVIEMIKDQMAFPYAGRNGREKRLIESAMKKLKKKSDDI